MRSIALPVLFLVGTLSFAQAVQHPNRGSTQSQSTAEAMSVPSWLPFPIPAGLYEKWRKYGPWDYKQQSFEYRDFTLFNFGATGSAAGLDKNAMAPEHPYPLPGTSDSSITQNSNLISTVAQGRSRPFV